ncbi:unnamed protein product, partial [Polarella glacialis]
WSDSPRRNKSPWSGKDNRESKRKDTVEKVEKPEKQEKPQKKERSRSQDLAPLAPVERRSMSKSAEFLASVAAAEAADSSVYADSRYSSKQSNGVWEAFGSQDLPDYNFEGYGESATLSGASGQHLAQELAKLQGRSPSAPKRRPSFVEAFQLETSSLPITSFQADNLPTVAETPYYYYSPG